MRNINFPYVVDYLRKNMRNVDARLNKIREYAISNNIPIIEDETYDFLRFFVNLTQPKKILEIGTAVGYSAIAMALSYDGINEFVSIEREEKNVAIANKNIHELGLSNKIRVIHGDALNVMLNITDKYDLIFIDASKGHYLEFFNHSLPLLATGGIIVCDNVLFNGMVANDELVNPRQRTIVKRMREFIEHVNAHKYLKYSLLPIGDGILLIMEDKND